MGNYGLLENEYDIVSNLYQVSIDIYNKLQDIKNGKKEISLTKLLEKEKRIYDSIPSYSLVSISDFINDDEIYNIENMLNYAKDDYEKIIKSRILNKLYDLIEKNDIVYDRDDYYEDEEILKEYEDSEENVFEDEINSLENIDSLRKTMYEDIIKVLIKITDNKINNESNILLKEKYNNFKYNILFIFDEALQKVIKRKFQIPEDIFLDIGFTEAFYNTTNELLKVIYDEVTWSVLEEQIEYFDDKDLEITTLIVRSALVFSSDKIIKDFTRLINDYNIDFFKYLNNDKQIPKLVLFKKNIQ